MYDVGELILRLVVAGICGILIGLERELRAKEAGVRTHFLVCLGSALLMIVSVFGFIETAGVPGIRGADTARIAAQIVSGIGFIGAGTIMVNRQSITGLTTAAGLWVVAGIGMAVGGGLYKVGICATLFVLLGLELLQMIFRRARYHHSTVVYSTANWQAVGELELGLKQHGWHIISHNMSVNIHRGVNTYRVTLMIQKHSALDDRDLLNFVQQFPDITMEKIDSPK
ncbi:MAG: MgtC/SapB family protein [Lentisphaeria bacterium]|nr:MgtC/SapB family protein [Lentisphaeria bacterium]